MADSNVRRILNQDGPTAFRVEFWLVWMLLVGIGITNSAVADPPATATADTFDKDHPQKFAKGLELFKKSVRQTLVQQCLKCHGGEKVEAELNLSDRQHLFKGGASGKAVDPGHSKASRLVRRLNHSDKPGMPFNGEKLPDATIAEIAAWIDLGAPYDEPLVKAQIKAASWTERVIEPEARAFWSFQPLKRGAPPVVDKDKWCRTSIDRFILAKLQAGGIAPNPAATKLQLVRRAYFDLLGLPPSPEEVDAFLQDDSSAAWDKLIDRLLDNPRYGERWARHWLDVARFAESHGFEHDTDRPTAYHFRDFVIQALNRDLPFDTFVKWQIAGDEFAPDDNLALMATGFLAAGVHSTQITKNEVEKHRYDELDDILGTIGQSMLGLSVNCARCHDHKFDPIPQRDYYRLLSTFTTTVRSEVNLDFDPDGYRRAKAAFDAAHLPLAIALEKFEKEQLPSRLKEWEKTATDHLAQIPWIVPEVVSHKSEKGTTFTRQPDGSYLAGGNNPQQETYTLVLSTRQTRITSLRLEALADPSLPKTGPGRAPTGDFSLTDVKLTIQASGGRQPPEALPPKSDAPKSEVQKPEVSAPEAKPIAVPFKNPRATFEKSGQPIAAAIDDNDRSGWSIDPQIGKDHAATFEFESPQGFDEGSALTVTLAFKGPNKHNLGRFRLSVSTATAPIELQGPAVPETVLRTLKILDGQRSAEQQAELLKWYATIDPEWQKLNQPVQDHLAQSPRPLLRKTLISSEGLPPIRLNTQGGDFLEQTHFLRRGDPNQKEAVAAPGFLQVLMPGDEAARWRETPPAGCRTSFRRRALANWLTDVDHGAGALVARVIVNRLWQHHFGRGIVTTPNDFGIRGAPPSHPELLDHLAAELVRRDWSVKSIHRLILQSAVYRQSSQFDAAKSDIDRDNILCWRRSPHRLEAEVIRDSLLAVAGTLDGTMFGPGTLDETSLRRSIYFTVKRSKLVPMMQTFDAPDALSSIGERPSTTVAPQALLLLNGPQSRACARAFANRVTSAPDLAAVVTVAYRIALARPPKPDELVDGVAFVEQETASYDRAGQSDPRLLALSDFCQVLMCLNEYVYVE